MKSTILVFLFQAIIFSGFGQSSFPKQINEVNPPAVALAPLRFLASDELMGRVPTRPEIHVAARYIAESFRSFGLKEVPGTTDYFQVFTIKLRKPATGGGLVVGGKTYDIRKSLVVARGRDTTITAPVIYAKHGLESELSGIDVKGKIVVTDFGESDATPSRQAMNAILTKKQELMQRKGALAIVERFKTADITWSGLLQMNAREVVVQRDSSIPVLFANDSTEFLKGTSGTATLTIKGTQTRMIPAKNVMGWVEGTDPKLKEEFIMLSAHYDHLGVAAQPKMEEGKLDSIYNGTRDNAIGTTSVIDAARYFAQYPARRSILFVAFTAEEMGLVGSRYFAEHPALPLEKIVFDLNNDNASYNDTTAVTFVGVGRTSADEDVKRACSAYGLTVLSDPTSGKLFTGSDNLPLAEKGMPATTFSLAMKTFDQSVLNRYHQLSDEVRNFDLKYAMKFINAYILSAKFIADNPMTPLWTKGDQYEELGKTLYQKKIQVVK